MPQADTRPPTEPFPQSLCFTSGPLGFAVSFLSKQDSLFISGQTADRSEGRGPILICNDQMRRSCFQELGWSLVGCGGEWGLAWHSVLSLLPLGWEGAQGQTDRWLRQVALRDTWHHAGSFTQTCSRHSAQIFSSPTSLAVQSPFFSPFHVLTQTTSNHMLPEELFLGPE